MELKQTIVAPGRELLIRTALKMALKTRRLAALGVRELGREAGLHPSTFYRHFSSLEDLGVTILDEVLRIQRCALRDIRHRAADAVFSGLPGTVSSTEYWSHCLHKTKAVAQQTMASSFDFLPKNPEAFVIGVSGLGGASSRVRQRLSQFLREMSRDLAEDIRIYQLLPMLSDEAVERLSSIIVREIFIISATYIETPEKRAEMEKATYDLFINLVAGAIVMEVADRAMMCQLVDILRDRD